eukprot:6174521-Pleurochrysis_carterae.AAC.1
MFRRKRKGSSKSALPYIELQWAKYKTEVDNSAVYAVRMRMRCGYFVVDPICFRRASKFKSSFNVF